MVRREEVAVLEFANKTLGNAEVVAVRGYLDSTTSCLLETHCDGLLHSGFQSIVLDFSGLNSLSSEGLRTILALSKRIQASGARLVFTGIHGSIRDMFDIAGFLDAFLVVDHAETGIA